jgi:hypothetical protein
MRTSGCLHPTCLTSPYDTRYILVVLGSLWVEGMRGMDDRFQNQGFMIAGFSAIIFGSLLIFQMLCQRLVGANVYAETGWPTTFAKITSQKSLYSVGAASGALASACIVPLVVGFLFSFERDDLPMTLIAGGLFLLSALLSIAAFAQYGNLVGASFDYVNGAVPHYVALETGDSIGDEFQILQYAAFVSFGVALFFVARLMLHSQNFSGPMAWMTAVVGVSALLSNALPILFIVGRLAWSFSVGVAWLKAASPTTSQEAESVTAY